MSLRLAKVAFLLLTPGAALLFNVINILYFIKYNYMVTVSNDMYLNHHSALDY